MGKHQFRRSVSLSPAAFYALKEHARWIGCSMSAWLDHLIVGHVSTDARTYGARVARELKDAARRLDHQPAHLGREKCEGDHGDPTKTHRLEARPPRVGDTGALLAQASDASCGGFGGHGRIRGGMRR